MARLELQSSIMRSGVFGGIAASFSAVLALRFKRGQEEALFSEYKNDIAAALGKPESEVSAKDWEHFKQHNPVLQQAAGAMHFSAKDWLMVVASAVGGGVAFSELATRVVKKRNEGSLKADGSKIAGGTFGILGGVLFSGQIRKLVYDHSLEGRVQNTAHGLLMEMKDKRLAGEKITPLEVMALQVAMNPKLIAPRILMRHSEGQEEKLRADFPEMMQQNDRIAKALNEGGLRPHQLVFALKKNGEWEMPALPHQKPTEPAAETPEREWGKQELARQSQKKAPVGMGM